MKKHFLPFSLAAAGLITVNALLAQPDAVSSAPDPLASAKTPVATAPTPPPDAAMPPSKLPPALKDEKAREKADETHVTPPGLASMSQPPPAPRKESQPPSPAPNYKWQPGTWKPVDGTWTWVAGKWVVPPDAASVWIEGRYDTQTLKWTEPYWQPDRPNSYNTETPVKDAKDKATPVKP